MKTIARVPADIGRLSHAGSSRTAAVLAVLLLAGCANVTFLPAGEVPVRPAKSPDQIKLFFDLDEPRCKYRVVGLYQASQHLANDAGGTMQVEPMRDDAAARGFDGVTNIRCAAPGNVGSQYGTCTGKGYICE